ncbi:MAG: hypothetical protein ACKVZJ_12295 [Phycisphaerales bacterium]
MTLRGYVKDGVVVPYDPSSLIEGSEVDISQTRNPSKSARGLPARKAASSRSPAGGRAKAKPSAGPKKKKARGKKPLTLREVLDKYAGTFDGLPTDLARNHDHYLHGKPKKP